MKVILIARRLLWQNRWLFLLLMLWPFIMAAILLLPGDTPEPGDVLSVLHQECFYGLALVAITASSQLGNEQRTRRILIVLGRAVSRSEYLFAILLSVWFPLLLYVCGFISSGAILTDTIRQPIMPVLWMAAMQIAIGILAAVLGVFWSIILPTILATIVTSATFGLIFFTGTLGIPGVGRLLIAIMSITLSGKDKRPYTMTDVWLIGIEALVIFAAAYWIFSRRDLDLTAD
jgi:hypothetical protein